MKKILNIFLLLVAVFFLFACNKEEITITSIEIDQTSVNEEYKIDEFDIKKIILIVNKSDQSKKKIFLSRQMVNSDDYLLLDEIGIHKLHVNYNGFIANFNVNIKLDLENRQLMNFHSLAVKKNKTSLNFEDWLIEIGENKQPLIKTITTDDDNNLILTFNNEKEIDFGIINGSDDSFINKIEIVNNSYYIYLSNGEFIIFKNIIDIFKVDFLNKNDQIIKTQFILENKSAFPPIIENEGEDIFIGWDKSFDEVTKDLIVKPLYKKDYFILDFDLQGFGQTIEPFEIHKDSNEFNLISYLKKPVTNNYIFYGWFKENECLNKITIIDMLKINKDTTVYAKWVQDYSLSFNINNEEILLTLDPLLINNDLKQENYPVPSILNYVFLGWYSEIELINKIEFNDIYILQQDTTLYAKWLTDFGILDLSDQIIGNYSSNGSYFIIEDSNNVTYYQSNNTSNYQKKQYQIYKKNNLYYFIHNNELIDEVEINDFSFNFLSRSYIKEDTLIITFLDRLTNELLFVSLYKENDIAKEPFTIKVNINDEINYWYMNNDNLYIFNENALTSSLTLYGLPYPIKDFNFNFDEEVNLNLNSGDPSSFFELPTPTKENHVFLYWSFENIEIYSIKQLLILVKDEINPINLYSNFAIKQNYQDNDIIGSYNFINDKMKIIIIFHEDGYLKLNLYNDINLIYIITATWSYETLNEEIHYYIGIDNEQSEIYLDSALNYITIEGILLQRFV